ncbi:MAG: hypothetical protein ABSF55_00590 [Candidatus Staskawiczbacteria bacterium]|jgi:hypothetical protein
MPTQAEETQAKEFLKRAEIRTMKKDLLALREVDSLKERDKIATIKTLEEQLEERKMEIAKEAQARQEKVGREEVLTKNEGQEKIAEKDLKNYATEQERQQIFLLESQRLGFEKQIDSIDKEKDPALKLEKNKILLQKRDWQAKLNAILEQEKKLEDEQKFIAEKSQTTTIPSERKGLESRRWDLDKEIQDVEKKRWEAEKQIQDFDAKVSQIDRNSDMLVTEKNGLRDKILGADKSLREIYSAVMAREEEKRRGQSQEQIAKREALAKIRAEENEKVQRQQWSHPTAPAQKSVAQIPVPAKKIMTKSFTAEDEQRKKFLQDVEQASQTKGQPQQKSDIQ